MSPLEVRQIEPNEYDTWDRFVEASPHGTIYHTSSWKRLMDRCNSPAQLLLIGCFEGHSLCAGCVLLDRERYGKRTAVTPLMTPYCGFLLEAAAGEKISGQTSRDSELVSAMCGWMSRRYPYQNLVMAPHLEDIRPLQQQGYRLTPRFTFLLNLKLPQDELWQRFDGSVRRQIKKAEKSDFELSDRLDADEAFNLFRAVFTRRGEKCPVSAAAYSEILLGEELKDAREVFSAHEDGRLAGYVVLLRFQDRLYYSLAATAQDQLPSGVSSLLIWEIVKAHSGGQWSQLDFVGANVPSIARFKEGFNPRLQVHFQAEFLGDTVVRLGKSFLEFLR